MKIPNLRRGAIPFPANNNLMNDSEHYQLSVILYNYEQETNMLMIFVIIVVGYNL